MLETQTGEPNHPLALPIGPKVVPFGDYLIANYEPQKGTTLGPIGMAGFGIEGLGFRVLRF